MSKLEYLIKENKRKKGIENCKKQLSKLLSTIVEENSFLTIEQTDLLTKKFYDSYKISKSKVCERFLSSEVIKIDEVVKNIYLKHYKQQGYLIIKQTEECGLLKISVEKILESYREIIELDGDSICILTVDESEGIYIDYYEENNSWYYELCYWTL